MARNKYIQVPVTNAEKKTIERQAKRENYGAVTEFIRKTVLDRAKACEAAKQ